MKTENVDLHLYKLLHFDIYMIYELRVYEILQCVKLKNEQPVPLS